MKQNNETIHEVEELLRTRVLESNPHACAEYRARLSGEYSFYAGLLEDILKMKPATWNNHRKDYKSDKACDRWYESTEDGINELGYQWKLKRITTLMQGLNGLMRLHEGQMKSL